MRNLILLLCVGCTSGNLVVVTVDSTAPIADVARLHASITLGGATRELDVPLAAKSIPPAHTFGVTFASTGHLKLRLEAFDGAAHSIGTVDGEVDVRGRVDLPLTFQVVPPDLDLARASDDGGTDLAAGDLAGDLAANDLTPAITCDPGRHLCGLICVLDDQPENCGGSCDPCPLPADANHATCDGTACGFACNPGFHLCGAACVADDDVATCGGACSPCMIPAHASAATCDGTSCGFTCAAGYHECGGACVRSDDPATCGSSCVACSVPTGGSSACDGTQCSATCPGGTKLCLGACIPTGNSCNGSCPGGTHDCSGLCSADNSTNSCGTSCAPCPAPANSASVTCDGTSCGFTCKSGYHKCGAQCLSDTDVGSCGAMCSACAAGPASSTPICASGSCNWQCNTNFKKCGNACIPSNTCCDSTECTITNQTCSGAGGTCSCPAATHVCASACVSNGSTSSCGSSCTPCTAPANGTATCNGTSCGFTCNGGFKACGAACIPSGDCCNDSDCGGGSQVSSAACVSGSCQIVMCAGGFANCDSSFASGCEANTDSSDGQTSGAINHCGSCGGTCPLTQFVANSSCSGGACHISGCSAGFLDCDGNYANGCEVNNGADNNNCFSCGNVCASNTFCSAGSCTPFKRVFVTSTSYDGNLGGPAGADAKCQARAVAGGLSGTYKAWISTTATPAATRQAHSTIPYMLVNRTRVANDWNGLISGSLLHAINVTELGTSSPEVGSSCVGGPAGTFVQQVWTATSATGTVTGSTPPSIINTCGDWTDTSRNASTGSLSASNGSWSQACGQTVCTRSFALYCLEQ